LKLYKEAKNVKYVNLNEEPLPIENPEIKDKEIYFTAKEKKIITLELVF